MLPLITTNPGFDDDVWEVLLNRCATWSNTWYRSPVAYTDGAGEQWVICTDGGTLVARKPPQCIDSINMGLTDAKAYNDLHGLSNRFREVARGNLFRKHIKFDILLEWCRINTEQCEACHGEGICLSGHENWALGNSNLDDAGFNHHLAVLGKYYFDRRRLEWGLLAVSDLDPYLVEVQGGAKYFNGLHAPFVFQGDGWKVCVSLAEPGAMNFTEIRPQAFLHEYWED